MTDEEKKRAFEEQLFKKKWAKYLKLSPFVHKLSKNVGKASKCNTRGPKKESLATADNKNNKKKR